MSDHFKRGRAESRKRPDPQTQSGRLRDSARRGISHTAGRGNEDALAAELSRPEKDVSWAPKARNRPSELASATDFTLLYLLHPIPERDFLADTFQKTFLHIPGLPDKFRDFFTWDDLNRILEEHRLQPPLVMLRKDGKDIESDEYLDYITTPYENTLPILNVGKLAALMSAGATLSLHEMHWIHRPLSVLLGNLSRQFTGPCDVILFASFGSTRAITPHEDGDDQFILQLAGRKHWQVFGPNEPNPIRKPIWHESTQPKRQAIWEGMLNAGDLLYLPRGWWHEVRSVNEPSLHLTIGLPVNTSMDLIHWALPVLARQDILRENLPRFGDRAARRSFRERMMAAIDAALHPDILDDYFRGVDADVRPAIPNPTFLWSAAADGALPDDLTVVRFTGLGWAKLEGDGTRFAFKSLGRDWSFPKMAEPILRPLLDGQVLSLGQVRRLARDMSSDEVNDVVRQGARGGLLTFG